MTSLDLCEEARERADLLCYVLRKSPVEFASQAVEDAIDAALDDPIVRAAFDAMEALQSRSNGTTQEEGPSAAVSRKASDGGRARTGPSSPLVGVPSTRSEESIGGSRPEAEKPQAAARRSIERAAQRAPAKPAPPAVPRGEIPSEESRRRVASVLREARGHLAIGVASAAKSAGVGEDDWHAIECARVVDAGVVRKAVEWAQGARRGRTAG